MKNFFLSGQSGRRMRRFGRIETLRGESNLSVQRVRLSANDRVRQRFDCQCPLFRNERHGSLNIELPRLSNARLRVHRGKIWIGGRYAEFRRGRRMGDLWTRPGIVFPHLWAKILRKESRQRMEVERQRVQGKSLNLVERDKSDASLVHRCLYSIHSSTARFRSWSQRGS